MKLYTLEAVDKLIERYMSYKESQVITIREGTLGYGTMMIVSPGKKTAIIQERYLNEWSSGHSVRFYNKIPKKYLKHIN